VGTTDKKKEPAPKPPDLGNREQVRRLRRGMERSATEVIRCHNCGHQLAGQMATIGPKTTCDHCDTAIHSCRHCKFFNPSLRFQCRKPVEKAIIAKSAGNECSFFEPRLVLDATGKRLHQDRAKRATNAFDALFKNP